MSLSPKRYFLDAPKEQPGTCFVLNSVYEEVHAELMHTRKFCRDCHGSGKVTSWDMNGGPPTVQCECRKVPTVSAKAVKQ